MREKKGPAKFPELNASSHRDYEDRLLQSSQYLENIINSVADPIFVKDRQHRWVLLNDACCRFIGHSRTALIGKSDYDFFPKEEADVFWQKDEEVFISGKENLNEESFTDSKGVPHVIVTKKTLYQDHLESQYIVGVIREVTAQKQAQEALLQKNVEVARIQAEREYLELFAYVASHDLQEPLQKVIAFAGLLKSYTQELDEKSRRCVDGMKQASLRMSRMIEDLLHFTKVTTGADLFEPVDLKVVIEEVLSDLDFKISKSKARVSFGDFPVLRADRRQMYLLFLNLIANALKFQKPGETPLISLEGRSSAPGFLQITVTDNGIGFNEKHAEKIFRPFERLHSTAYEGSGIGLAICKKIVARHGGTIAAASQEGKGTVFSVTLPLDPKLKVTHEIP